MKRLSLWLALVSGIVLVVGGSPALAQKYGGELNALMVASPPSLSIHDDATVYTSWTMMPVYNNLVLFDQLNPRESFDSIVGELAESWAWNQSGTELTFRLRQGVKWHDGKPFTAADVKHTWDVIRGTSSQRTKLNPRKTWYRNVKDIVTEGDAQVTFKLARPQPSLLVMLASGYSPVYPAHVPPQQLRTQPLGTGPFKLAEYARDRFIRHVKNTDYWRPGRPYLDSVRYLIIRKRGARLAALENKQADVDMPNQTTMGQMTTLQSMAPGMSFHPTVRTSLQNVIFNTTQPPFNDAKLRQVVSLALDREAFIRSVYQGGMKAGSTMLAKPDGAWGFTDAEVRQLPGYGDVKRNQAKAREIMASLGYSAANPLRGKLATRNSAAYVDAAVWTVSQLKEVWMAFDVEQMESAVWFGALGGRKYTIAVNSTGLGADDPDVNFYENYSCASKRNYSDYCNPEVQALIDKQSAMLDRAAREKLVHEVDRRLVEDVARVVYGFRINYNAMWPYVKNLVPHQTNYSYGRMEEVWLDK